MDEKSNLYVFEKKEVFLLFIFMILIALTSFMLGVKIGKGYSYDKAGLTIEDRQNIELLSGQEEDVNKILEKKEEIDDQKLKEKMHESLKKKIMDEMSQDEANAIKKRDSNLGQGHLNNREIDNSIEDPENQYSEKPARDQYTGKFTIQLSSHRSKGEATEFSNGFTVRGYDPIINEVELRGKGIWYRVSLGIFDNVSEAKDYILKEKELFQGQDYVIGRFD